MKKLLYTFTILLFIACNKEASEEFANSETTNYEEGVEGKLEEVSTANNITINKQNIPANRKIIWTANLEIQVENLDNSQSKIADLIAKYNGFISEMRRVNEDYQSYNYLTIRISNEKFNSLLEDIKSKGLYTRKMEIQSNDVTEEYIDITSRLKTKKQVRERYINILKTKTGKISDVIEAEEAIRVITEEIEAKKGRLRYLKDQISLSTIHLMLYQVLEKPKSSYIAPSYWSKAKKSFVSGWQGIMSLSLVLINIWPLLIVGILILWKRKKLSLSFLSKNNKT